MSIIQFKKLVFLSVFIVLASCTAEKPRHTQLEGSKMLSEVKETWGYGCGSNCSFNSDGSYSTTLSFGELNSAAMKNAGQFLHVIHYPNSFILGAKKWVYDYQGTWDESEDAFRLELKLIKSKCNLQRSEGKRKMTLPCEKPRPTKTMDCKKGEVSINDSTNDAFICKDDDENETVFGIGKTITEVIVGEPSIKRYFYGYPNEKPKETVK